MSKLLESIARWIDRSDAGDISTVIFVTLAGVALVGVAFHP